MKNPFHKLKEKLNSEDQEQPFLEHLEAFRQMMVRGLIAIMVCTLICIPVARPMLIMTQLQMAIPLYLLYEFCIGILRLFERREQKRGSDE